MNAFVDFPPRPHLPVFLPVARLAWYARLRLRAKLLVAFAAVLTLAGAQAGFAYRATLAGERSAAWTTHTYQVIGHADAALAGLVNMETGYRGFLVTGRDSFLEPYETGKARYQVEFMTLDSLTADNPVQRALGGPPRTGCRLARGGRRAPPRAPARRVGRQRRPGARCRG